MAAMAANISKLLESQTVTNENIKATQAQSSSQLDVISKQLAAQYEQTATLISTIAQNHRRTHQLQPPNNAPPMPHGLQIRPPKLNLPAILTDQNPLDWLWASTRSITKLFYSGLRQDIQQELAILRPHTITQAIGLAKLIKDKTNDQISPPQNSSLTAAPAPTSEALAIKRLSPAEMQKRRVDGLCFNCPEKYSPGHKCNPPKFLLLQTGHDPPLDLRFEENTGISGEWRASAFSSSSSSLSSAVNNSISMTQEGVEMVKNVVPLKLIEDRLTNPHWTSTTRRDSVTDVPALKRVDI
ncbi:hypothetical protein Tco_1316024, partial [Tanacetum coccineum]